MGSDIHILLKKYRQLNNYSQAEVANYLQISAPAYNHYESGNREPNVTVLTKLAELYHLEDQILGVQKPVDNMPPAIQAYTINSIYENIFNRSYEYELSPKYENKKITLLTSQYEALCQYFSNFSEYKKTVLCELASSKTGNDGKLYEALTYAWLEKQGIPFIPQVKIKAGECLNPNGYEADGIIAYNKEINDDTVVFDVKMFGITHQNIDLLQSKLNKLNKGHHEDFFITVSGSIDLSNSKMQKLLSSTAALYQTLFLDENKHFTDYWFKVPGTELEIRAHYSASKEIINTVSDFNPFRWARENQFYFFHDASQFCTDKPFIILCPYDIKTARHFTSSFYDTTMVAFRSLCRRMFLGMPDNIDVCEYDEKCPQLISLRAASQCISAVVFQDISMNNDNDDTWIFINPNARNKIPNYVIDQFRYHLQSMSDDFSYDIY